MIWRLAIVALLCWFTNITSAQQAQLIDSVAIQAPQNVSIDRLGNIYITHQNGSIDKYDPQGKFLLHHSPPKPGNVSLIEAWNPLRLFLFYRDFQEYQILDRFLTTANRFDVRSITPFAGLVAPSIDNNIWIVDYEDFGLKKYDINFNRIITSTSFDLLLDPTNYNITHLREYQNLVFISDINTGILIFDNLGNYIRTIKFTGIRNFNVFENKLYFSVENKIVLVDIYDQSKNEITSIGHSKYVLLTEGKLYCFSDNWLKIFKLFK